MSKIILEFDEEIIGYLCFWMIEVVEMNSRIVHDTKLENESCVRIRGEYSR